MKYYKEREGLLNNEYKININDLREYFFHIYRYFNNRGCFNVARQGVWKEDTYGDVRQVSPPLFMPSEEVFFVTHLRSDEIYPIIDYYEDYSEVTLFTVIEILYSKIAVYNRETDEIEYCSVRKEFAEQINNVLRFYGKGYYLEPNNGIIIKDINEALKVMFKEDLSGVLDDDLFVKMKTAVKMYYRFDSNIENKKKAINILADILEPLRSEVKDVLNKECGVNKKKHDDAIFNIVNGFNIRHNDSKQIREYEHEIWYDWMMQYYSSVIIAYYKIKNVYNIKV